MEWKEASTVEGGVSIPERWIYLRYYEAFNLLFRIENALRVFVYIVLKDHLREGWADAHVIADDDQGTIASLAKKRLSQAQTFGYLGHPIACPIMHLNSGELTRLIVSEAHWKLFKPYFLGSKEIIKSKLDEIGSIRNSFAHFRPVRSDDVDVIKQNSKHVLLGIEQFLKQALVQGDVVPTNTQDDWYRALKTIGTDQCVLNFRQSADERWVRIGITYRCPIIEGEGSVARFYAHYTVLTVRSSAILTKYSEIAKDVCYLSETVRCGMQKDGEAEFSKLLSFVLSRSMLESHHQGLETALEELLLTITEETDLIQQDNLARGQLVHSTSVSALDTEKGYWKWNDHGMRTPVAASDPPEYWGDLSFSGRDDFVSATAKYPWMPEDVSTTEIPF